MPKECVEKKIRGGMSIKEAVIACYPRATSAARTAYEVAALAFPVGAVSKVAVKLAKKKKKKNPGGKKGKKSKEYKGGY